MVSTLKLQAWLPYAGLREIVSPGLVLSVRNDGRERFALVVASQDESVRLAFEKVKRRNGKQTVWLETQVEVNASTPWQFRIASGEEKKNRHWSQFPSTKGATVRTWHKWSVFLPQR